MSIKINYAPMNNAPTTAETCTINKIEPFKEYVGYVSEWDGSEHVTDEQIMRCRDCRYYEPDPDPIDPGWPMMCERTGDDMVEPYGFCAWGERREG